MNESRLSFRTIGIGQPLLLVHGFGISFNIWNALIPLLSPYFMLIIIELPGIGHSPLPESGQSYLDQAAAGLESLRTHLNIEGWAILGYSSGTRVVERYLQSYHDRVSRAVFLCPAQVSAWKGLCLSAAVALDKRFPQLGNWALSGRRLKFLIDLLGFNFERNDRSDQWLVEISSQPLEILKETLRGIAAGEVRSFCLPRDIPAYFIWGTQDLIVDVPEKLSPLCDFSIRAMHSAPQTAPQQVAEAILPCLLAEAPIPYNQ